MDAPSTCSAPCAPTLLQAVPAWPSTFPLPSWALRHARARTLPQSSGRPVPEASPKGYQPFLRTCPKTPSLEEEPCETFQTKKGQGRAGPLCPNTGSSIVPSLEHSPKQQAAGPCSSSVLCSWSWREPGQGVPGKSPQLPWSRAAGAGGTDTLGSWQDPRSSSTANTQPRQDREEEPPAAGLARSACPPAASSPPAPCCRSPRRQSCGRPCWRGQPGTPGRRRQCTLQGRSTSCGGSKRTRRTRT